MTTLNYYPDILGLSGYLFHKTGVFVFYSLPEANRYRFLDLSAKMK